MIKVETPDLINLVEYVNKIKDYDYERLLKEKAKLEEKTDVLYTVVGVGMFWQERENISKNPDELNRIYLRKRVAVVAKHISSQLKNYYVDFSSCWNHINECFMRTTMEYVDDYPDYVTARLHGKKVPYADKLNVRGLKAYKNYLMFVSDQIEKTNTLEQAVNNALVLELSVDTKGFDRKKFYTNKFLPTDIDAIFKKVLKIKTINERMKELGNVQKIEK